MDKTFGEMTLDEKSRVSHRGKALMEFKKEFDKVLRWLDRRFEEERILRGVHDICQR
jgi:XTP/dITP diphosphohydrolase